LSAADQLQDVEERRPLELPAVGRTGDPDAPRAEERTERGGVTTGRALEKGRAVVQLEHERLSGRAEAKPERGHGAWRRETRWVAERAEALADRAPARGGDGRPPQGAPGLRAAAGARLAPTLPSAADRP